MLVEIHMIQNHSPSNVNRDDLGAPKTSVFGSTLRGRISSQCLKRSIRRSQHFREPLHKYLGIRTKFLPDLVRNALKNSQEIPTEDGAGIVKRITEVAEAEKGGAAPELEADDRPRTAQLIFLGPEEAAGLVRALVDLRNHKKWGPKYRKFVEGKLKGKDLVGFHRELRAAYAKRSIDVSMFGRMTTSDAFEDVEAAMEVAHAISTHEVRNEVDYFTAVDDLSTGTGAGHVDENQFNSACYYKYFSLDWDMLVSNLAGPAPAEEERKRDPEGTERWEQRRLEATQLAGRALGHFLRAAALTVPSGKKKGHANNNLPDGILVEVKKEHIPTSYGNAFADAVKPTEQRGLVAESIARLGHYVGCVVKGYGIDSSRLWFSPQGHRLEYMPLSDGDGQEEKPVVMADQVVPSLDQLIAGTLKRVGVDWEEVKKADGEEEE